MYAVERLSSYISRGVYTVSGPFHPFGGAVDIIVVQQPDGSFKSSPWYVKFGKFQGVLKTREKVVSINVNGVEAEFHMYLDHKGEAYFFRELNGEQGDSVLSPPSSGDETEEQSQSEGIKKSKSGDFDANHPSSAAPTDEANANILTNSSSRRSGILGFVFGRKSMKKDGSRSEGSCVGAERMSSLERTEIAADLLEVKWSTDLPIIEHNMDNASKFAVPVNEVDEDLQANNEESPGGSLLLDIINISSDLPFVNVETDPCNNSASGPNNPESSNEATSPMESPLTTDEQFMEISTFEAFDRCEIISEVSTVTDEFSSSSTVFDERTQGSVSESTMAGSQNPNLVELEAGQSTHSGIEQSSGKMSTALSNGISEEKTENENFNFFTYSETTEISTVGMNGSFEQATERLEFCYGRCEEVEAHAQVLYQNSELITEVTLQPDSRVLTVEENLCSTGIVGDGDFSDFLDTKTVHENELTSLNPVAESLVPINLHVSTFNYVETEILQVNHQDTVTDGLPQNDNLKTVPVEVLENESPITDLSHSHISEYNGVDLGKPSKVLVLLNQEAGVKEIFDLIEEAVPQSMHTYSDSSSSSPVQWKEHIGLDDNIKYHCPSSEFGRDTQEAIVDSVFVKESIPPSGNSEEDLLLFGDIDGLDPVEVQFKEPVSQESMQTENHPALILDGIEDDSVRVNINHASSSSPGKLDDEYPARSFQGLIEESGTHSSPISIPKAPMASGEKGVWLPESLPIIRHIDSLKGSNAHHPLSHSLDSNSENLKLGLLGQVASTLSKPDADSEHNLAHEHPRILGTQASEELGLQSTCSPVERAIVQSGGSWRLWPFPIGKSRTVNSIRPALNSTRDSDASDCTGDMINDKNVPKTKATKKKVRSIIPTSEQLATLNLEEGRNFITFTFSTAMLGRQQVDARIYLWKWNTRIVVSDVDGTITKSDVLGQFMPLVGKDWSQTGVTHLFSAIKENGYQLLFLSARAISQASLTRQFLFNLKQDGKALPDGPVVISPDGLFPSLYREVIRRAPHEFKIACLEVIKALFPPDCHPFYAGFGNRDTDEISYLKVGIPKGKIFIINPKGEVAINRWVDTKSYTSLHALVNGMFPAMSSAEQEDFNSWNYWKVPLPEIIV
ncbi:phosphatidate phosphatase PAH2-like isoform X2 [Telopea speciosissima]|uniref:phosphatidate phosphatase PAH2-like isoform X2 n=1 Tax=Telopea speciosissima TaxID=54955 RepID=UPI001CC81704|nr:phosphatidate phosphatase PAH2-like isoform X2 [Telopea speciosissima]